MPNRMAMRALDIVVALAAAIAMGCGGSGGTGKGGGSKGAGGASGGGTGGAAGSASGSSGASGAVSDCPAGPPGDGSSCSGSSECFYQDCASFGRSVARCNGGAWTTESAACAAFSCSTGPPCEPADICVATTGVMRECVSNACATVRVSCECTQACSGGCRVSGLAQGGFTISCL